ncbi:Gfo/Idh/MocA family protein [Gracilimonas mengyeensis]|uniref:Predicted dehydrogenase n=1 Tax=Gracilimonas mengyeensis TaxID=1302730 RepID=A0A521D515_9BACT|nr:Gfo/Idh/MocA family oxidoreductase [Gracilimonas mengyeensis]SMO66774.1 Predicted dehydrogenase [Gracilimonas mengyeensis]
MDKVKWGIIGCGDVTEVKSGPAFSKIEHSELVAVMRRNATKAEDYAKRHKVPKWYADAGELIHDPDVNAIYIATPPNSHAQYTKQAAAAGKPVYVEKPMALNYAECNEMIEACDEAGVPLFVAYYRRALPYFLKVKELLGEEAIGKVNSLQINLLQAPKPDDFKSPDQHNNWRTKPEISGGGYFHDLASHQLDLVEFLLGEIKEVSGHATNQMGWYEANDVISACFKFQNGATGNGLWNFTVQPEEQKDEIIIIGREGSITFSTFNDENPVILKNASGKKEFQLPYPPHVQQPLIQTVVNALRGKGDCASTGKSGARANLLMDRILES